MLSARILAISVVFTNMGGRMVFLWLAVPWVQSELDIYRQTVNTSKKRHDKHKILPQGRSPIDIYTGAVDGVYDFKASTSS